MFAGGNISVLDTTHPSLFFIILLSRVGYGPVFPALTSSSASPEGTELLRGISSHVRDWWLSHQAAEKDIFIILSAASRTFTSYRLLFSSLCPWDGPSEPFELVNHPCRMSLTVLVHSQWYFGPWSGDRMLRLIYKEEIPKLTQRSQNTGGRRNQWAGNRDQCCLE